MKWEYTEKLIQNEGSFLIYANDMGADGWELCAAVPRGNSVLLMFRRSVVTVSGSAQ